MEEGVKLTMRWAKLQDRRSILELYRGVRSPPDSVEEIRKLEVPNEEVRQRLERVVQFGPEGILTNLFQYQKVRAAFRAVPSHSSPI